jgi:polysaccharide biosynthesis PFTS motif protein
VPHGGPTRISAATAEQAYQDILKLVSISEDIRLLVKMKRFRVSDLFESIRALKSLDVFSQNFPGRVEFLKENIDPFLAFSLCDCTVSLPFTSAAIAGSLLGLPSVYYYPSRGIGIGRTSPVSVKARVLENFSELERWIASVKTGEIPKGPGVDVEKNLESNLRRILVGDSSRGAAPTP